MTGLVPPPLQTVPASTLKRKRVARVVAAVAIIAMLLTGASYAWKNSPGYGTREVAPGRGAPRGDAQNADAQVANGTPHAAAADTDTLANAPTGVRVKVRVINTTKVDGLAKKATALLRDRGFDVVDYEGDPRTPLDSTLVLTNSGHDDWSERVVRALGAGKVQARPDSSRYLDLTVLIGRDWRAPSQPFRP